MPKIDPKAMENLAKQKGAESGELSEIKLSI